MGLLLVVVNTGGCGRQSATDATHRLVVIGIDSADWSLLDPLCAEDRLPNLAAFRRQAASGKMLTFRPLEKSPLLWASICTGVRPSIHGVGGFVEGPDHTPVRGSAWRAPALWDIIGAVGLTSAIIGMWTTYPARQINGVMVSDYLPYGSDREKQLVGLVKPDSLVTLALGERVRADEIPLAELGRFIAPDQLERCTREYPSQLENLRSIYAADRTYFQVARQLAAADAYDLFFFYLRGPDMISHKFWRYYEPAKSPTPLTDDAFAVLGQVVPRYYEWVDELLSEVLAWFPPERQVVILSDHGFYGPRKRASGWQLGTQAHGPFGIFLVRSPYYEAGTRFERLELLDICPTFLALLGLPPSQEMPGRILTAGLTAEGQKWIERLEGDRVISYQDLTPPPMDQGEVDPEIDETIREQLRSLGYIK
jgi:predicted AlkP superfamily phosphohydrolase/phosphomutase